jgi:hypothetical protein
MASVMRAVKVYSQRRGWESSFWIRSRRNAQSRRNDERYQPQRRGRRIAVMGKMMLPVFEPHDGSDPKPLSSSRPS